MSRLFKANLILLATTLALGGCGPSSSTEDMGTPHTDSGGGPVDMGHLVRCSADDDPDSDTISSMVEGTGDPDGDGTPNDHDVDSDGDALAVGYLRGEMRVLDSWGWRVTNPGAPFAFIPAMFALRAQWKKAGNGAEKVLKLGLNSLYGKMAQQVGGSEIAAPRYHCMEAAGWITSTTRARLFRAGVQAGPHAIMLATDAVYSTAPLNLENGGLGTWEPESHATGTFVQSGVYWVGDGEEEKHHYRGFDADSLERDRVRQGWADGVSVLAARSSRFVTMGQAVGSVSQWKRWRQWVTDPRRLRLTPATGQKREWFGRGKPGRELLTTYARQPERVESLRGDGVSAPVFVPWRALVGIDSRDALDATRIESELDDAEE